ncbi:MAG: EMC3/TMCO1 family protein [Thermoplasmatota archaeon]
MAKKSSAAQGSSQLLLLMLLMFVMLFIFGDPSISSFLATSLNSVFYPLIGFDGAFPVLTLILAGVIVVFLSSFFQNLFTDWKKMGESQQMTKAFQKQISKARKEGDTNQVNKLMKKQPEIMRRQTEASSGMMKPMFFLFIFIVPIFMWLRFFLGNLSYFYFTVPWATGVSLFDKPIGFLWQAWLWLYLVFSMVVGQVIRQGLKWISWSDWWKETKKKILPSF